MIEDRALEAIAHNLARLDLSPALHLRIAVAVVGPLLGEATDGLKSNSAPEVDLKQPPRPKPAAAHKPARARPGAKPAKPGEAAARAREALDLDPTLSTAALAREARCAPTTAKRVLKARKSNGPEPPPRSLSAAAAPRDFDKFRNLRNPDALARAYFQATLARGPLPCADVDAEIEAGRLSSRAVDRVLGGLDLVAIRWNSGKGATAHYVTRARALEMNALVPPPGERDFTHTGPRPSSP